MGISKLPAQLVGPSADLDEAVAALPVGAEVDHGAAFVGERDVEAIVEKGAGFSLSDLEQVAVAEEVGDAETGHAGLTRAEELARAAELKVHFGDLETVVGFYHLIEPLLAFVADLFPRHQNAE